MKFIFSILIIFIIVIVGGGMYANHWYNNAINEPQGKSGETYELVVKEGESFQDVATKLKEEGKIKSATAVKFYIKIEGKRPEIKFGTYSINADTTIPELIETLEQGTFKPGISVTLREGYRHEQMAQEIASKLGKDAQFKEAEFNAIVENPDQYTFSPEIETFMATYLPSDISTLEGLLYPDTYQFDVETTSQAIVEKMLINFISRVEGSLDLEGYIENKGIKTDQNNVKTLYDAVILGSIIEKEASAWDDRAEISGVFHNRLENDMYLQTDASINYITGKNDPGVELKDIEDTADNPYNLYKHYGLTPTPISNPRIESITAALYPNTTDAFFFLHTKDGRTFYADTFQEHQVNIERYLGTQ